MHLISAGPDQRGARRVIATALGLSLAALLTACGPGEEPDYGATAPGATAPGDSTSAKVSPELVGEWQEPSDYLTLGRRNLDIYDPRTGWPEQPDDIRAGSGIRITADGQYVWSGYAETYISGSACHSSAMSYQRGSATQDGQTIVLEPDVHRKGYRGGCNSASDMDQEESHAPQRWGWQRVTDEQGRVHLKLVSVEASHDYVLVTG